MPNSFHQSGNFQEGGSSSSDGRGLAYNRVAFAGGPQSRGNRESHPYRTPPPDPGQPHARSRDLVPPLFSMGFSGVPLVGGGGNAPPRAGHEGLGECWRASSDPSPSPVQSGGGTGGLRFTQRKKKGPFVGSSDQGVAPKVPRHTRKSESQEVATSDKSNECIDIMDNDSNREANIGSDSSSTHLDSYVFGVGCSSRGRQGRATAQAQTHVHLQGRKLKGSCVSGRGRRSRKRG